MLCSSIAGLWHGSRTEAGLGGKFAVVSIDLSITQAGQKVSGTEHRGTPADSEYFADLLLGGSFVTDQFYLQDQSIAAQARPSNYKWLLYTATLALSADGQTLEGPWQAGHVHGTMTLSRVPLPIFTLKSASTRDHNSVNVEYTVDMTDITAPLRFDIYRSKIRRLDASSELIGTQVLTFARRAADLAVGTHHVRLISGTAVNRNAQFPYVIVVANRDGAVFEALGSMNGTWFAPS